LSSTVGRNAAGAGAATGAALGGGAGRFTRRATAAMPTAARSVTPHLHAPAERPAGAVLWGGFFTGEVRSLLEREHALPVVLQAG
jgi:hypothetical protein